MRLNLICSAILCFMVASFQVSAQTRKMAKDSSTVIIFNQGSSTATAHKKKKASKEDNVVKIAPLGLLSGTFPILYERRITDYFTVQVGAGLTSKNYARILFQGAGSNSIEQTYTWNSSQAKLVAEPYEFKNRTAKLGSMFSIQPRFYFDSEAPDGNFLGLSFDTYKYSFTTPGITGTGSNPQTNGAAKDESDKITDFMVHFGQQSVYDNLTFEYAAAIGMRSVQGTRYAATYDANDKIIEGLSTFKQNGLNFNIGIKVGYHF